MPAATFSTVSPIISGAMPAAASTTSTDGEQEIWRVHCQQITHAHTAVGPWHTCQMCECPAKCAHTRTLRARANARARTNTQTHAHARARTNIHALEDGLTEPSEDIAPRILERLPLLLGDQPRQLVLGPARRDGSGLAPQQPVRCANCAASRKGLL